MTTGILKVSERATRRIHADRAEIEFKVVGSSFVLGQIAAERCAELKQLIDAIKRIGLSDDCIDVREVKLKQSKGRFLSSSSAVYKLAVRIDDLDQIAEVVGALQSGEHVELERIRWDYDNKDLIERELCAQATRSAMLKAEAIAAAAGQRVVGIRVAADRYDAEFAQLGDLSDSLQSFGAQAEDRPVRGRAMRMRSLDIGTTYAASQEVIRSVMLEVFLEPLEGPAESTEPRHGSGPPAEA
ncbi:MAG: SIMPL domain-containing protein [Planctomycetota bacterium]